ncbi:hemolysin XhlA family protein [Niameybacter massiliensis]|uniref:hemolysin XhlA family protein n=1 Tax=Niameybacter massiliensis TaxID=1658108 RepID=UPI0006B630C8|nr:hemolysin XhlA family protein [Niameybacter massiliensis]
MDEQLYKDIRKISDDMIFVKTTLENMTKNQNEKFEALEEKQEARIKALEEKHDEKIKVANHRITDLEEQNKWLWRTVLAAVIVQLVSLFFR